MHVTAHLDVDLVAVEADDEVTVLLELEAPTMPDDDGPAPQTLVVVLDRSGSMSGPPLDGAKDALIALVDRLRPNDAFGVVMFDNVAEVAVPVWRMADVDRGFVKHLIAQVQARGTTDLSAGYLLGLREARDAKGAAGATVLLVSDGHANAGETDPARLGPVAGTATKGGVTTATLGLGRGYDEVLLAALSRYGNGAHRFAEGVDDAVAAIVEEAGDLLAKSALNVQVVLRPSPAVSSYGVYGDLPVWPGHEGALVVGLGDMYGGERRKLLLRVDVPGMAELGLTQVTSLELRYVGLPALTEHTVQVPISVNVVPGDDAAGRVPDPKVRVEKLVQEAQSAKAEASQRLREGRREEAAGLLRGAAGKLKGGLAELGPMAADVADVAVREAEEIDRLAVSAAEEDVAMSAKRSMASYSAGSRGRRREQP